MNNEWIRNEWIMMNEGMEWKKEWIEEWANEGMNEGMEWMHE